MVQRSMQRTEEEEFEGECTEEFEGEEFEGEFEGEEGEGEKLILPMQLGMYGPFAPLTLTYVASIFLF